MRYFLPLISSDLCTTSVNLPLSKSVCRCNLAVQALSIQPVHPKQQKSCSCQQKTSSKCSLHISLTPHLTQPFLSFCSNFALLCTFLSPVHPIYITTFFHVHLFLLINFYFILPQIWFFSISAVKFSCTDISCYLHTLANISLWTDSSQENRKISLLLVIIFPLNLFPF